MHYQFHACYANNYISKTLLICINKWIQWNLKWHTIYRGIHRVSIFIDSSSSTPRDIRYLGLRIMLSVILFTRPFCVLILIKKTLSIWWLSQITKIQNTSLMWSVNCLTGSSSVWNIISTKYPLGNSINLADWNRNNRSHNCNITTIGKALFLLTRKQWFHWISTITLGEGDKWVSF